MKTIKLLLKLTASLLVFFGLASCNKEDEELPACQTCALTYNNQSYTEEFCPEDFDSIEAFDTYIIALENLGSECN
ncbi:MAG: hypothetical protein MK226_14315 [Saprospiraceae bacterium]|nr:hypothetical protein [Saprospiraceae bacterium]